MGKGEGHDRGRGGGEKGCADSQRTRYVHQRTRSVYCRSGASREKKQMVKRLHLVDGDSPTLMQCSTPWYDRATRHLLGTGFNCVYPVRVTTSCGGPGYDDY